MMKEAVSAGYKSEPLSLGHHATQRDGDPKSPDNHGPSREERYKKASTFTPQRENDERGASHISRAEKAKTQYEELSKVNAECEVGVSIESSEDAHQDSQRIDTPEDLRESNSRSVSRNHRVGKPSGGFFSGFTSISLFSDRTEEPNSSIEKNIAKLEDELRFKDKQLDEVMARLHKQGQMHQHQTQELRKNWANICQAVWQERSHLEAQLKTTMAQLELAKKEIQQQEAAVTNTRARQISDLASNVSNELPDDKVREALRVFFQGDFFSWCSDLCAPELKDPDQVAARLHSMSLLNTHEAYLRAPKFLKLDLGLGDGEASLPLLQAALSSFLCREFLTSPYFLVDINPELHGRSQAAGSSGLDAIESALAKVQPDAAMDWRINTLQTLEKSTPMTTEAAGYFATVFLNNFQFLINEIYWDDKDAKSDLVKIIQSFANLSLRLWKKRGRIYVHYINRFANDSFPLKSPWMDADAQALATLGSQVEGRPIALLMRPSIISQPLARPGDVKAEVPWLKALAWISGRVDGDETMGQ
ncbi:unnamed protein product [Clonostachys chloroleuca]|uniref:Uncharacterized protein n=1 Tax=Clonostachys chloroleuca TaxID=1926264 RepID=A0AA35Q0S8_9HYPO|nr:unnamed protein product [Clonostachys chloroleuca]